MLIPNQFKEIYMNKKHCVYTITNLVNGKQYVGVTGNLKRRWKEHKTCIGYPERESKFYLELHQAGLENINLTVIASNMSEEDALLFESTYITKYSYKLYNTCPFSKYPIGAANRTARLTEDQAKDIIARREKGELFMSVYADYKHLLKRTGIESIWLGKNWSHLQPDYIRKTHASRKLTDDEIRQIRSLMRDGAVARRIAADFGVSPVTICNILKGKIHANIT